MYWCLPFIAVFVFVGHPYLVCFAAQWLCGWPDEPGFKKYTEALNPRRIYRLTFVTMDLLKYFYYLRLYYQIKSWYRNEEMSWHFKKGIVYGSRGNKLDLYYPPKRNRSKKMLPPLVMFVYGGAWSTGHRSIYCLLARKMAGELNAAVVCPDYSTYPKQQWLFGDVTAGTTRIWLEKFSTSLKEYWGYLEGNVLTMVQDIADCLIWAQENAQTFCFDKDRIVLVGHSAGAHLAAMATLLLLDTREELLIDSKKQQEILDSIKGVIGISGVYSIMDHYEHEKNRGIEFISCMSRAMNGEENFPSYSPVQIVQNLSGDKLRRAPRFVLLHGCHDVVVPVESSTKFYKILSSLSVKVSLHLLPAVSHTDIVTDLMQSSRAFYHPLFECIKWEFWKILSNF